MAGTFALIGVLIAMIVRANKEFGKIESKKINYAHIALMVFAVLITSLSMNFFFTLVLQFEATVQKIYVDNGFFSPMMNTLVWIGTTALNLLVVFSIMSVARRSENGRKLLVAALPFLFLLSTVKSVNEVIAIGTPEIPFALVIGIIIIGMFISFLPLFLFYSNQHVKSAIFDSAIRKDNF